MSDCRIAGGGTPIPRMDLDSPCVHVSWRVALFGRLGREEDVLALREVGLELQVNVLHWVGQQVALDRLSREWTCNHTHPSGSLSLLDFSLSSQGCYHPGL